jgi:hypothetical protein
VRARLERRREHLIVASFGLRIVGEEFPRHGARQGSTGTAKVQKARRL